MEHLGMDKNFVDNLVVSPPAPIHRCVLYSQTHIQLGGSEGGRPERDASGGDQVGSGAAVDGAFHPAMGAGNTS